MGNCFFHLRPCFYRRRTRNFTSFVGIPSSWYSPITPPPQKKPNMTIALKSTMHADVISYWRLGIFWQLVMLVFRVVSFVSQTSLTFEISIGFLINSHQSTMFCQGLGMVHQTFQSRFPNDNRNGPKVNVRILFGISMSGFWLKIIGTAIWFYQEYIQ